jgi:hypothetical protein
MIRFESSERGGLGTQQRAKKSQSLFYSSPSLSLSLSLADRPSANTTAARWGGNERRESDGWMLRSVGDDGRRRPKKKTGQDDATAVREMRTCTRTSRLRVAWLVPTLSQRLALDTDACAHAGVSWIPTRKKQFC